MSKVAILGTPLTKWVMASAGHCVELWNDLDPDEQQRAVDYALSQGWMTKRGNETKLGVDVMEHLVKLGKRSIDNEN